MSSKEDEIAPNDQLESADHYAFHADSSGLLWEYIKVGFALVLGFAVWIVSAVGSIFWWLTLGLLVAFMVYLGHTIYRHGLRIEMDREGITTGWRNLMDKEGGIIARRRYLSWAGLSDIKLRFYSRTPKSEQNGWMMVQLIGRDDTGAPLKLTFDGAHEGFKPVLSHAWQIARERGLPLDEASLANLEATGIDAAEGDPWTS